MSALRQDFLHEGSRRLPRPVPVFASFKSFKSFKRLADVAVPEPLPGSLHVRQILAAALAGGYRLLSAQERPDEPKRYRYVVRFENDSGSQPACYFNVAGQFTSAINPSLADDYRIEPHATKTSRLSFAEARDLIVARFREGRA